MPQIPTWSLWVVIALTVIAFFVISRKIYLWFVGNKGDDLGSFDKIPLAIYAGMWATTPTTAVLFVLLIIFQELTTNLK